MKRLFKYLSDYIGLIAILVAGFLGFRIFSFDRFFQVAIATATAAGYVIWGIVHHSTRKEIYVSLVLEYVIVAFLGLVMVLSLILRT